MKNKFPSRDLRLTKTDGQPVTLNFNFVALREPASVLPHDFEAICNSIQDKNVRIEGSDDKWQWRLRKYHGQGNTSISFNRESVPGTLLTVAIGSTHRTIEVVQTPEEIDGALLRNKRDIHPSGLRKCAAFESREMKRVVAVIATL